MFLGLQDPDPLVRGMDPAPDPSITMQKQYKKNFDSYYFVTHFDFLSLKNDVNVPSKSNKQKNFFVKSFTAYYFLKVYLHHFSKIKSQKEDKTVGTKVFLSIA